MHKGRSGKEPLFVAFSDPEFAFRKHPRKPRTMAGRRTIEEQLAELTQQLNLSREEALAATGRIQAAETEAAAARTELEEFQATQEALPKNAADFLKPVVKTNPFSTCPARCPTIIP